MPSQCHTVCHSGRSIENLFLPGRLVRSTNKSRNPSNLFDFRRTSSVAYAFINSPPVCNGARTRTGRACGFQERAARLYVCRKATRPRRKGLREYRVAVMMTDPCSEVDSAVQDRLQALADFLGQRRAKVSDRARPDIDTGVPSQVAKVAVEHPEATAIVVEGNFDVLTLHEAVLKACDVLDGVKDGVIENPTRCAFDLKTIECKGADGPSCLTPAQVESAKAMVSLVAATVVSRTGVQSGCHTGGEYESGAR